MLEGLPRDETWRAMMEPGDDPDNYRYATLMTADPDCRVLYELAWVWDDHGST